MSNADLGRGRHRTAFDKAYGRARLALRIAGAAPFRRRRRTSLADRLNQFPKHLPLRGAVRVRWNDRQVPFIEAEHDQDAAVALGAVHVHLRSAQMDLMRRVAYGRLSEAVGRAALELDQTLRTLDFPRAVPETLARMPAPCRGWVEHFVSGVNAALAEASERPEELALLGLRAKPWSAEDVLALGKLAAMDFSWRVWHRLLPLRARDDWAHVWQRLIETDAAPAPGVDGTGLAAAAASAWGAVERSGSNAAAVSAARSATGGALLTSDPHLSIMLPNNWLIVGLASPGFNLVGLMIPGIPVITLGRNRSIAWSGTSLHAASSDLFDVSTLPAGEVRARQEAIAVRWQEPSTYTVRETELGPIISDAPLMRWPVERDVALKWIGHRASDEISAMLAMMKARDWPQFTDALDGFAAPAQNFIFADDRGRVGQAMGAHLPSRPSALPADLILDPSAGRYWQTIITSRDLPRRFDPPQGFVASANDRPAEPTQVPVGFFFSPDERIRRLRTCLERNPAVRMEDLVELHRDVAMPSAQAMRDRLLSALDGTRTAAETEYGGRLVAALREWDGVHDARSEGALAFELFLTHFLTCLRGADDMALYRATLQPWSMLQEDMASFPEARISAAAGRALVPAADAFVKHRRWGEVHRLKLSHPFKSIPVIGRGYAFSDEPVGGSNETLMKTAHGLSSAPHAVAFGANARFLADLGDPDATFAVLLGGQDGWLGSSTFVDQLDLWRNGRYCSLPLTPKAVETSFPHVSNLHPAEGRAADHA